MKGLIDPNIDGKNVEFVSSTKRSHSALDPVVPSASRKLTTADMMKKKTIPTAEPRIATNQSNVNENQGWEQYGNVFL